MSLGFSNTNRTSGPPAADGMPLRPGALRLGPTVPPSGPHASPAEVWLQRLHRLPLVRVLTKAQCDRLSRQARLLRLRRSHAIYSPGDPSDYVYIVQSGAVMLCAAGESGQRSYGLAVVSPGQLFGELAVIDDSPRDHVAKVLDGAVVCAVHRGLLRQFVHESPDVAREVMRLIGLRVQGFRQRLECLHGRSARARVARTLLDLGRDHGLSDAQGTLIPLRLRQADIGDLAGLSREAVNGVLRGLSRLQAIETSRAFVRLKEIDTLVAVSEGRRGDPPGAAEVNRAAGF